jgi:Flp pilus assembly protein TadB
LAALTAICTGLAVLAWMVPQAGAVRRLRLVAGAVAMVASLRPSVGARATLTGQGNVTRFRSRMPAVAALAIGMLVAAAIGGTVGALCGIAGGVMVLRSLRRSANMVAGERRRQMSQSLPLATELLAACIASGAAPGLALTTVAEATGGPLADELRRVVAALELGGDPVGCWLTLGTDDLLGPLGAAFSRSAESGAPLADLLSDLALDLRAERRVAVESAARRVGIRAAAPLGLCFLPAFILLGLVPIVGGLVGTLRI